MILAAFFFFYDFKAFVKKMYLAVDHVTKDRRTLYVRIGGFSENHKEYI